MGIKGLSQFIKKKSTIEIFNFNEFKNEKIAIDASIIMYAKMSISRKYICNQTDFIINELDYSELILNWKHSILNFLLNFINNQIEPILIFDGDSCKEKDITHLKREKQRNQNKKQLDDLNYELEQRRNNIFQDHSELLEKYRKKMTSCVSVPKKIQLELIEFLKNYNIECIISNTEAEKLCTSLCIENKVKAVYTSDTDVLPMGCPLVLKDFKVQRNGSYVFTGYRLSKILKDLDMDFNTFQDFCILCGCDFNTNIKGYGPVKCYKQVCNLQELIKNDCLNYNFCKQILNYTNSENLIKHNP